MLYVGSSGGQHGETQVSRCRDVLFHSIPYAQHMPFVCMLGTGCVSQAPQMLLCVAGPMNLGPASLPLLFPHYLSCLFICRLQPKLTRLDGLDGRLRSLSAQRAVAVCPTGPLRTLLQNLSNARAAAPLHSTSWWILRQIRIRFYYRCAYPSLDLHLHLTLDLCMTITPNT